MKKTKSLLMKCSLLTLTLILSNAANAYAQNSGSSPQNVDASKKVQVTEAFIKKAEETEAKLRHAQQLLGIKDEQLKNKDDQIAALRASNDLIRQQKDDFLKSVTSGEKAIKLDDKIIESFKESALDWKLERQRLITERDAAISSRTKWTVGGVVVGIVIGVLSQRGN